MTENEVIKDLQNYQGILKAKARINAAVNPKIALNAVTEAIEIIEEYRAIGTVEELQALKEKELEPIVNGKWIDTQPNYRNGCYKNAHVCSNCNDYYTTEYEEMKFCPKCGAKMIV